MSSFFCFLILAHPLRLFFRSPPPLASFSRFPSPPLPPPSRESSLTLVKVPPSPPFSSRLVCLLSLLFFRPFTQVLAPVFFEVIPPFPLPHRNLAVRVFPTPAWKPGLFFPPSHSSPLGHFSFPATVSVGCGYCCPAPESVARSRFVPFVPFRTVSPPKFGFPPPGPPRRAVSAPFARQFSAGSPPRSDPRGICRARLFLVRQYSPLFSSSFFLLDLMVFC